MRKGFYPALGTPFDEFGNFIPKSFKKHVRDQVEAGAAGLLIMGSMGIEPYIKNSEYAKVAKAGVEAAKGTCPVFTGVMDNSISRVMDRIRSLDGLKIDGVVITTPYYYAAGQNEIKEYFIGIAEASPFPVYLYDLPVVTKTKITAETIESLMCIKNIKGVKTGDIVTARQLMRLPEKRDDFSILFSGLDVFDVAYKYGLNMNLDGMFSCTAPIASKMYKSLGNEDFEQASKSLDEILMLRNVFVKIGVFNGFTYAMNLLGYEGVFSPDYVYRSGTKDFEEVKECMKNLNLI